MTINRFRAQAQIFRDLFIVLAARERGGNPIICRPCPLYLKINA